MALTRKFKETVQLRVKQDTEYRKELIIEATNAFLEGDVSTGKTMLRDYLNATESLPSIARELVQGVVIISDQVFVEAADGWGVGDGFVTDEVLVVV